MPDGIKHNGRWTLAYRLLDRLISLGLVVQNGDIVTITRAGRALAEKTEKRDA